jgi:hypothetical protein
MKSEKKQAVKKQRAAWVQGQSLALPERQTTYERELIRLGLEGAPIDQLVASEELRAFAVRVRHERYIPDLLLHRWGLRTIWSHGERSDRHLPKFSLYDAREACPVPAQ